VRSASYMILQSLLGVTCAGALVVKCISWRSAAGQTPETLVFSRSIARTQQHDVANPIQDGINAKIEYEGFTLVVLRRECEWLA